MGTWGFLCPVEAESLVLSSVYFNPRRNPILIKKNVSVKKNPVSPFVGGLCNQFPKPAKRRRLYWHEGGRVEGDAEQQSFLPVVATVPIMG